MNREKIFSHVSLAPWRDAINDGSSTVAEGLWDAPKTLLISLAQRISNKNVLFLSGASQGENRLFHDFPLWTDCHVVEFPAWDTLPGEAFAPSPDVVGERYQVLESLCLSEKKHIIITSPQACLQRVIDPEAFISLHLELKPKQEFSFSLLVEKLTHMGYQRRNVASDKGEFAVRGGIVDVFPVALPDAFRIEFFGDTIESIRLYDPVGQKSIKPAPNVTITAGQELELVKKLPAASTILQYVGADTLIVFDDLLVLEDRYTQMLGSWKEASSTFLGLEEFLDAMGSFQKIYFSDLPLEELSHVNVPRASGNIYSAQNTVHTVTFEMFGKKLDGRRWLHPFLHVADFLLKDAPEEVSPDDISMALSDKVKEPNLDIHCLAVSDLEENTFRGRLARDGITLPETAVFERGYQSSGFALHTPEQNFLLLPYTEFTHRYKMRRQKLRSTYHTPPSEIYELKTGETVVHTNSGIGKFLGVEKRLNHNGVETEFFLLEYADKAKLYVPIDQANLISKYIGSKELAPPLHTLGSSRWKKAKEHAEQSIMGYASQLLESYAKRAVAGGFAFPPDSEDTRAFEDEFPFVETEDQLRAIEDVKKNMGEPKAMDRLICGDVGYGKTEVAMRAAFKAVVDGGKQVAVLVPTTVLAMQHYDTFRERMGNFPINVEVLARTRSPKEIHAAIEGTMSGKVDIVIGTHRIISKDIVFKNLGLVIIDEEQRFGVRAKEHLKHLKAGVDCLTLSATPIPRTLYMSMMGARDMSVVSTPPQDRLPITSVVAEPNDITIKNALMRELTRDGQALFIHNRVEDIYEVASHIKTLLPHARVLVGHGQMDPEEIDNVFHMFKQGLAEVLVATTIVENGIDIPNCNTILVDRADTFGLADLYQLRGRVGRWNRKAFAYFLVPQRRSMDPYVKERLSAMMEISGGYGGGMRVALKDLEIRGAGDILGTEQSGQVSAIGFHLYCKLLKRTIDALQGKIPTTLTDTRCEFAIDARLPEDYVNAPSLRMEIYHRLGEASSFDMIDEIWGELKDRFGDPPEPAKRLYYLSRIRVQASRLGFILVKWDGSFLSAELKRGKDVTAYKAPLGKIGKAQDLEEWSFHLLKHWKGQEVKGQTT